MSARPEGGGGARPPADPEFPSTEVSPRLPPLAAPAAPREPAPVLAEGELVAGRYRVVAALGRGGGGEVYEVEDLELGQRVALKTLNAAAGRDPRKLERFRREVNLARRVTHPNVCRLHDLGRHELAPAPGSGAPAEEVLFLTMELLRGPTLAARLRAAGALPTAAALPIAQQIAAGLDAAHRAGVVHRDFKSSNVLLVPDLERPGATRAVVTDFGLALPRDGGDQPGSAITGSGVMVGTPAYMAPEQVAGEEVTAAADLYAFGVVLYEMVTGSLPFAGRTPLSTAVKRLSEPPPSPRVHVPGIDPDWERVILRCLARLPAERHATAGDAAAELAGGETQAGTARGRGLRRTPVGLAIAAGALLLVAAALWRLLAPSHPAVVTAARPVVAVLGFQNLSGRPEASWLSTGLAEMLATELAVGEKLRPVPGEQVARMKLDLGLDPGATLEAETLPRVRARLGTDFLVLGSYTALGAAGGGAIRLDLRLEDGRGRRLAALREEGTEAALFDLVRRAGAELRRRLGVAAPEGRAVPSLPRDPEAARLFAEGLDRLRVFDALQARGLLEGAVSIEPSFSPAHAALADAWDRLGYEARARASAERAFALAQGLEREEKLQVEARYREAARDWERAIELYRGLWTFYPDDLEHGLRLARVLGEADRAEEGLALAASLAELPPPAGQDPRIDLAEALAAGRLGDFARRERAAAAAAAKGERLEARLLVAEALVQRGSALHSLGRSGEAAAVLTEAQRAYRGAGDLGGAARAVRTLATVLRGQGELDGAARAAEEALQVLRQVGDQRQTAAALNTLANVRYEQGRLAESAPIYEQTLAVFREIGERRGEAAALGNLANVRFLQGELAPALEAQAQALEIKRELEDRSGIAVTLISIGLVRTERGELSAARAALEEALATSRATGEKSLIAYALHGLGEVARQSGDLAAARRHHQEAASERRRLGEPAAEAESRLALAQVSFDQGEAAAAAAAASEAAAAFAAAQSPDGEALAHSLTARARLALREVAEARRASARAAQSAARAEDLAARLRQRVAAAEVLAATDPGPARRELDSVAAEAARRGYRLLELEARLALAGQDRDGAGDLAARAERMGLDLVARKARALAAGRGAEPRQR